MTEYWKSQAKKFCDFCKCWISDNKASRTFHENGKRHQQAVENRLYEIKRKGAKDEKKSTLEEKWLQDMEEKAMSDYRKKDLGNNSDLTAQIFNQKRAQRDAEEEGEECDRARKAAQKASLEASMEPAKAGSSRGPMVGPQIETPNSFLRAVKKAPTSGTRWHNPPGTKKWNEAQTEEGHIYYWNIDTNESRWDAPPEGYSSIIEQRNEQNARDRPPEEIPLPEPQIRGLELPQVSAEEEEQRRVKLVQKKLLEEKMEKLVGQNKKVAGPQAFPSSTTMEYRKQQALPLQKQKKTTGANSVAIPPPSSVTQFGNKIEGPVAKGQPFGAWQTIEKRVEPAPVDYMAVKVKEGPQANVTLHSDRMTKFTEKVTPSLGGASTSDTTTTFSKPKIVFNRKRKINDDHQKNIRKREDE